MVFWPVVGNHDYATGRGTPWRTVHYTPANNAAHSEQYYSFDHGNAHFTVLDSDQSTSRGSPQYAFLAQDLAASTAPWKFVFFHHAIYVSSGANSTIRSNLVPLFDAYHVDVVFMGHVHLYERSKPLRGNKVVAPGAGTVYVTTGGGGASLHGSSSSATTARAESAYHYTRVTVDGGLLALEMIRSDGKVRDTMTLQKGPAANATTTTSITTTSITTTSIDDDQHHHTSTTTTTLLPPGNSQPRRQRGGERRRRRGVRLGPRIARQQRSRADRRSRRHAGRRYPLPQARPAARRAHPPLVDPLPRSTSVVGEHAARYRRENADDSLVFATGTRNVSTGRARRRGGVEPRRLVERRRVRQGAADAGPHRLIQQIVDRPGWASGHALTLSSRARASAWPFRSTAIPTLRSAARRLSASGLPAHRESLTAAADPVATGKRKRSRGIFVSPSARPQPAACGALCDARRRRNHL
jgi:hypothetical protein